MSIISTNRQNALIQGRTVILPWDESRLGVYGRNQTTDAQMDEWALEQLGAASKDFQFPGFTGRAKLVVNAGRNAKLEPVVAVRLGLA